MGAGIFFAGYFLFEVPGALIAERYSPRLWLARIMITWGVVSGLMAFMQSGLAVLRAALPARRRRGEPVPGDLRDAAFRASSAPGTGPAPSRCCSTSLQVSGIIGAPLAGWLMGVSLFGLEGWQVLFLVEALPAVLFGLILPFWMADWPREARWLSEPEKAAPHPPLRARGRGQDRGPALHGARGAPGAAKC